MKFSIKNKIVLMITLLILLFGSIASYSVFLLAKDNLIDNQEISIRQENDLLVNEVRQILLFSRNIAKSIAGNIEIVSMFEDDIFSEEDLLHTTEHFLKSLNIGDMYSAIYIIDKNGLTLASTEEAFVGKNYGFRDYFIKAMSGNSYSDVSIGVTSNELGYYFSHPIINEKGEVLGVVVAKLRPEIIAKQFASFDSSIKEMMLVDSFGVIINSTNKSKEFYSLGLLSDDLAKEIEEKKRYGNIKIESTSYGEAKDFIFKPTASSKEFRIYDEDDNEDEFLVLSKIDDFPFYVMTEVKLNNLVEASIRISILIAVFVLLSAVTTSSILAIMVSKLIKPLEEFQEVAKKVSEGNLLERINVKSDDEIGSLAESFNKMIDSVRETRLTITSKVEAQTNDINEKKKNLEDQQHAILNVLQEVEEQNKKLEVQYSELKKFQLAVEYASDHIIITDIDGIIIYANKAMEEITGFKRQEILGKKAGNKELWGGQMEQSFYKKLWKTIKEDKETFVGEINNKRKNGQKYVAHASVSPILNKKNEVVFFVGIERDVTYEKEVDKMKTEFISLASHQLRTPLSAMRWFLEMLLGGEFGELNKEQKDIVVNVDHSNQRMISLVNGLLNISRIESGRIIIKPELTDISDLVNDILLDSDLEIKEKGIALTVEIRDNVGKISIDPNLIGEVCRNLITNAIKYSKPGGEIKIFVLKNEKDIIFQISDNGMGIPKNDQPKIFEKFHRASNAQKTNIDGSGLGLYLVKLIIQSSNGEILFKSEENKGTTFWFTIPTSGMSAKEGEVQLDKSSVK